MIIAQVRTVNKDRNVSTGEEFLDVTVDFLEDDELVVTKKFGYPVETSAEEIKADLAKAAENLELERQQAVVQKAVDAREEHALEVKQNLEGHVI